MRYSTLLPSQCNHRRQINLKPKRITPLIKNANEPKQLLQLLQRHAPDVNSINVSTAYSVLKTWCQRGAAQALQAEVRSAVRC